MSRFNVVVKNWKTGEVKATYLRVTETELVQLETEHHAYAPADWDMEVAKV